MKKTLLYISIALLTTQATLAKTAETAPVQAKPATQVETTEETPGYSPYLDDAPAAALDATVLTLPEHSKPSLFLSNEGLFRYSFYEKTGTWLRQKEVHSALAEPYDQGNW